MKLKRDRKFGEKSTCRFKIDIENLTNFYLSTRLLNKIYIVWAKKYRGVISHDIEEWCKIWRKIDLLPGKWQEFGKFSPEHLKVSKLELWWDPIVQSRKCMSSKFTEKLCVMTMKNDTKIEEELTCHFKIDMRNFTNFDPSVWKSKKVEF